MVTDIITAKFNPEAGRWYNERGEVVELVPSADGKKRIKPDIRHARRFGFVPSVTTVCRQVAAPGLENWKLQQVLLAALSLPRDPKEPLDYFAARVMKDYEQQAEAAAQQGTALHAALNRYWYERVLPDTDAGCNAVHAVDDWLRGMGATDVRGEVGFATPQYGGTADLRFELGSIAGLADFKTMDDDKLPKWKPFDDHGWQLAGYARGLGLVASDRWWNIGIGRKTGACVFYEWAEEDCRRSMEAFNTLLRLWQIRNHWQMPVKEQ